MKEYICRACNGIVHKACFLECEEAPNYCPVAEGRESDWYRITSKESE